MPMHWALKAEMRERPSEPGLAPSHVYWIEELGAWIAEDEQEAETIREAMGEGVKILFARDLE